MRKLETRCKTSDIREDGSLSNRRVWAQFQSDISPDGICLDKEGGVWVAGSGLSAVRVREGAEIAQQIATTKPVFDVALGGLQRNHLFLCTSVSNDPVVTRQAPGATIEILDVAIPGIKLPDVNVQTGFHESHLSGILVSVWTFRGSVSPWDNRNSLGR